MADPTLAEPAGFRTIGQLAERCGHYCWLENRLFALTGSWASAPAASTEPAVASGSHGSVEAEVRVVCSEMSSWHGFVAGAWWDRLPVRAGVDAGALVVPPAGPIGQALDLLEGEESLLGAFAALVGQVLPALLAAYVEEYLHASAASEAPVHALLDLVRPRVRQEIGRGQELVGHEGVGGAGPSHEAAKLGDMTGRLQRLLGVGGAIFPVVRAS